MKITVIGSTGGTGRKLVHVALNAGHSVTAVARYPDDVMTRHQRLTVHRGDVLEPDSLTPAIAGAHAVLSALGTASGRAPTTVYSGGVRNILAAMRAAEVDRFVGISAAPVIPRSERTGFEKVAFPILYRFFGGTYADLRRMEDLLRASQSNWTVLRPPMLTDKRVTGKYRTAHNGNVRGGRRITRGDLATAMLDVIGNATASRSAIGVSN